MDEHFLTGIIDVAFLTAYRKFNFESETNFKTTFFCRGVIFEAIKEQEKLNRHTQSPPLCEEAVPDGNTSKNDQMDTIQSLLKGLPRKTQKFLILHIVERFTITSIADSFGMHRKKVEQTIKKALEELSLKILAPSNGEDFLD